VKLEKMMMDEKRKFDFWHLPDSDSAKNGARSLNFSVLNVIYESIFAFKSEITVKFK
jgi:hypothetical protein